MKILGVLICAFMLSLPLRASTLVEVNAGILPYACFEGEARYLLAFDPVLTRRAWAAFGGGPKSGETAYMTALREFREETNCAFDHVQVDKSELKGPVKTGSFYSYVLKVPALSVADIEQPRPCVDVERYDWVWVPHGPFMAALASADDTIVWSDRSLPLWPKSLRNFRNAVSAGVLTEADPCGL